MVEKTDTIYACACPACDSTLLAWAWVARNGGGAVDGRIKMNEVRCDFVLGCEECSETVRVVPAHEIENYLTEIQTQQNLPL